MARDPRLRHMHGFPGPTLHIDLKPLDPRPGRPARGSFRPLDDCQEGVPLRINLAPPPSLPPRTAARSGGRIAFIAASDLHACEWRHARDRRKPNRRRIGAIAQAFGSPAAAVHRWEQSRRRCRAPHNVATLAGRAGRLLP